MCKASQAQLGVVYQAADAGFPTETLVDPEDGGFICHVPVGEDLKYVRTADGFEEVRFDWDANPGECPWKTTGRKIDPPLELREAGRFVPTQ
jgi:hypothetical protein